MPPRRGTRTATAIATTPMTDVAIRALIARGVADALTEHEIQRNTNLNGDGSQGSGSGIMRLVRPTRECTYSDFLKCQPLNFKGIEWEGKGKGKRRGKESCWSNSVTVGHDAAYGMPWKTLLKIMTAKYCPRSEIKKLEIKILNLKVKCTDVVGWDFPYMIQGNVMSARLKTMQEAIELANDLMGRRKEYAGTLPLCNKCKFYHNGPCTAKCANCKKVGHLKNDCWNPTATSNQRTITCYECGNQGHYKSDCPELENQNHGNQAKVLKHMEWCMP
ncbi:reverse transcriptase domain-containing protein [Tanacetum coccineum]